MKVNIFLLVLQLLIFQSIENRIFNQIIRKTEMPIFTFKVLQL